MYKYSVEIEVHSNLEDIFVIGMPFRNSAEFLLAGCYFKVIKDKFGCGGSDTLLVVFCNSQRNRVFAEQKLKEAVNLFSYVTGVPFEIGYISENEINIYQASTVVIAQKKKECLDTINNGYNRCNQKRQLLLDSLRLYSSGLRFDSDDAYSEDAFFAYFKIVEMIAKDEFKMEKGSICRENDKVKKCIEAIFASSYYVTLDDTKMNELVANISGKLFTTVFNEAQSQIARCLKKNEISFDKEVLGRAVGLRNDIAHGDFVNMDAYKDEINLVREAARKLIRSKFWRNDEKPFMKVRVKEEAGCTIVND